MNFTTPAAPALSQTSLKHRFLHTAGWTVIGYGLSQVVRLGSNLVMTRLLAPELFGVMAIGYVVITGLVMFSDIGLGPSIVQSRRGDEQRFLNVCWVMQIARGSVITLVGLAAAAALHFGWLGTAAQDTAYADPRLPGVVAGLSFAGIITGLESTKAWSARRQMAIAKLTQIELTSHVIATAIMLLWAWLSPSIWALVAGWLIAAALKAALTHAVLPGPLNRFEWDRSAFTEVFHFGKWIFLSSIFSFLLTNGDRLVLGGLVDSHLLGLYAIAYLLLNALQQGLARVLGASAMPAFSEVVRESPQRLAEVLYKVRRPLDLLCAGVAGLVFVTGEQIVHALYDDRYLESGPMLAVLSLTLLASRVDVFDQCLLALGKPRQLTLLNGIRLTALYASLFVGFELAGMKGALLGIVASAFVNIAVVLTLQAREGLLRWRRELLFIPAFLACGALGMALRGAYAALAT